MNKDNANEAPSQNPNRDFGSSNEVFTPPTDEQRINAFTPIIAPKPAGRIVAIVFGVFSVLYSLWWIYIILLHNELKPVHLSHDNTILDSIFWLAQLVTMAVTTAASVGIIFLKEIGRKVWIWASVLWILIQIFLSLAPSLLLSALALSLLVMPIVLLQIVFYLSFLQIAGLIIVTRKSVREWFITRRQ